MKISLRKVLQISREENLFSATPHPQSRRGCKPCFSKPTPEEYLKIGVILGEICVFSGFGESEISVVEIVGWGRAKHFFWKIFENFGNFGILSILPILGQKRNF